MRQSVLVDNGGGGSVAQGGEDDGLGIIIARIQKQVKERRLLLASFFRSFDSLKLLRVTKAQFIRALTTAGLRLHPAEFGYLAQAFPVPGQPDYVHYGAFCDNVDEVFSLRHLEKTPALKVRLALKDGDALRLGVQKTGLTDNERARVASLLEGFACTMGSEGLDVKTLFMDHDHHCTGCISKTNFMRAIYPLFRREGPKDSGLLARAYEVPESGFINYKSLLQDLQGLYDSQHPQHAPLGLSHPRLSTSEAARIRGTLTRLARASVPETEPAPEVDLSTVLLDLFHHHDPYHYGRVSRHQFLQVVGSAWNPSLTPGETELLTQAYTMLDGKLDYIALDQDFRLVASSSSSSSSSASAPLQASEDVTPTIDNNHPPSAQSVEMVVAQKVTDGRIKLLDHFRQHDRLRSGLISQEHFHRVLSSCLRTPLAVERLDALVEKHCDKAEGSTIKRVNYVSFLQAVAAIQRDTYPAICDVPIAHLTQEEQDRLGSILSKLRSHVSSRRPLIRPVLEDFDRTRQFYISREQLLRVLTIFDILPPSHADQQLLLKAYQQPNPLDPRAHMVNYARFLADIDDSSLKLPKASKLPHRLSPGQGLAPVATRQVQDKDLAFLGGRGRSADTLLKEIRAYTLRNRVNLMEQIKDQDPLKKGYVSRYQLAGALARAGLRLSDSEVEALADLYIVDNGKKDSEARPLVRWLDFLDDVNAVFGVKNLQVQPQAPVAEMVARVADSTLDDSNSGPTFLNPEEEKLFGEAMSTIAAEIRLKCNELLYLFKDQDKQNRGYLSQNNFIRVISSANLVTPTYLAKVTDLLVRKFREPFSLGAAYVNYRAFLHAIKLLEAGSLPDMIPSTSQYRSSLRKGAALPQVHHVSVPETVSEEVLTGLDETLILAKLKKKLTLRRINLAEFLADGDAHKLGDIPHSKFRSALGRAGLTLKACELEFLEEKFAHPVRPDRVNWKAFYHKLMATPPSPDLELNIVHEEKEGTNQTLMTLLQEIRERVEQQRINMKPYFLAYDHTNTSEVTFHQLASIMSTLGFKLMESQRHMLCKAFAVKSCGANHVINYRELLKRIDP